MSFNRLLTAVLVAAFASAAQAGTIYVDDDNCPGPGSGTEADPYCSIQTAIDAAADLDEVVVAPGTYSEMIVFAGRAVTLRSSHGPAVTILDGGDSVRAITCGLGERPDTVLDGFTITGRSPNSGGGMLILHESSPTVRGCTFRENSAHLGGGLAIYDSSPLITNCTFIDNAADDFGGGMSLDDSSPTITNCTFIGNSAGNDGGGIFNFYSSPTLSGCTFHANTANADEFGEGGALFCWGSGSVVFSGCTFSENVAARDGGGVRTNSFCDVSMTNCVFFGNTAGNDGGGFQGYSSNSSLTNCTFLANEAQSGGGIRASVAINSYVTNCILWDNVPDSIDGVINVAYSNVQGGHVGVGNIDVDPQFLDAGDGDLRLSPGSPCIDAGDNTAVPETITTDLDGNPRFLEILETPDTGNGDPPIVDMGAYESLGGGCLAITNLETVCHGDGSYFTVHVVGLNTCTGGTTTATFTGAGGAVGEDFCATMIVNTEQGGFCCSTQVCVPVPDCSGTFALCDLDGDGIVGVLDFLALLSAWGPNLGHPADFDGDGDVGVSDFLLLLAEWD